MMPLHQSTGRIAASCLARYKAEVLDGHATDNAFSQVGTAVHYAIEIATIATSTGNREPLDCALEALDAWWAQRDTATTPVWVFSEAETILRKSYSEESRIWLGKPKRGQHWNVEVSWFLDDDFAAVKEDEPHAYAGRMDRVQWGSEGLFVKDLKTIRSMPSSNDLATDLQARVYSLAALAMFPDAKEVTFQLLLLRHGYTASHTFVRGEPWERATKRWLRAVRQAVEGAHRSGEWPETPGEGCSYCVVSEKCAALSALKARGSVPEDISPESAARSYLALKTHVAGYERIARKAAEDGPIPVGIGRVLGFKAGETEKWKYGVADLLGQLRADGATEEDLREWFPGPSISKALMEAAALILLKRGEIECAEYEYVGLLREKIPSATFTTFMGDSDE